MGTFKVEVYKDNLYQNSLAIIEVPDSASDNLDNFFNEVVGQLEDRELTAEIEDLALSTLVNAGAVAFITEKGIRNEKGKKLDSGEIIPIVTYAKQFSIGIPIGLEIE